MWILKCFGVDGKLEESDPTSSPSHLISGAGTSSLSGEYKSPYHLFLSGDCADPDLNSPRSLSDQARQELDLVNQYLSSRQLTRVNGQLPVRLFCFRTLGMPTALMGHLSPSVPFNGSFYPIQPSTLLPPTLLRYVSLLSKAVIESFSFWPRPSC